MSKVTHLQNTVRIRMMEKKLIKKGYKKSPKKKKTANKSSKGIYIKRIKSVPITELRTIPDAKMKCTCLKTGQ